MAQLAERRDLAQRAARERLAHMLGLHPRELAALSPEALARMTRHLNVLHRRLQKLVDTGAVDEMTGALRRPAGLEALEREMQRARRFRGSPLAVTLIDVDGLKAVNDTEGHGAGDRLIKDVAATLRKRLRAYDLVIRWGGDEFVCVLPDASRADATRIVEAIATDFGSRTGHAFSCGFAELSGPESAAELVARADSDLYECRRLLRRSDPPDAGPPPFPGAALAAGGLLAAAVGAAILQHLHAAHP